MNRRKKLFAIIAAAVLGTVAPQAFADDHRGGKDDKGGKGCEPEILSSSVQASGATVVSGVCLDLADAVSTSGPPKTKTVNVEAWVDGAFVPLAVGPGTGSVYTKNAVTNVLETIAVCSLTDKGDGVTTVRITRPYVTGSGKAKSTTEESKVAVAFDGNCPTI
jgi:hypothetical protein